MDANAAAHSQFFDTAPGIRLHARVSGPEGAPTLLFVHGFPEFWFAWRRQLAAFSPRYRCVALDLRGFNQSSQPPSVADYAPKRLVADLAAVVDALGAPLYALIAHDWGGALAWSFAAQHPSRLARLAILNAPHPVPFARALAHDAEQIAASQYMNWLRREGSEQVLAAEDFRRLFAMQDTMDDAERAAYRAAWQRGLTGGCNYYRASPLHPDEAGETGRAAAFAASLDVARTRVEVPTQLIWGMADRALRPVLLDGLEALVPRLRIERIADAGHWLLREHAEQVNAVLARFLAAAVAANAGTADGRMN